MYPLRLFCIACLLLAGFTVTAQQSPFDTTMYGRNTAVGKYADIRGFKMYYEVYGKGEPLLLIHGNGGSINNFVYQIPFFYDKYQVIIADSRSHGKSVDNGDSLSYEMMADDLAALLDVLKVENCHVIGWSDGGIEGLLLAMRHPKKVKKLAVTGANLSPDTSAVDPFPYKWAQNHNKQLKAQKQTPEIKTQLKQARLLSFEPHISLAQLKTIQCPTLVIGGDNDVILPEHTLLIARNIPKAYCWILPGSGHSTPINFKDEFNNTIQQFFVKPYKKFEGFAKFD